MSDIYEAASIENAYFYATFITSEYTITASAVCVFYMNEIIDSFNGDYSVRKGSLKTLQVPNPRPSSCPANLTNEHLLFSRKNVAMKNDVNSEAIIIESGAENSFLKIDVDFHVKNAINELFDVLFIGTDNGHLLKFVIPLDGHTKKLTLGTSSDKINNFYKEKYTLGHDKQRTKFIIDNLKLVKPTTKAIDKNLVLILNSNKILTISKPVINNCYLKTNRTNCDNNLNPYCVWINNLGCCKFYDANDLDLEKLIIEDSNTKPMNNSNNSTNLIMRRVLFDLTTSSYSNNNNNNKNYNQNIFLISLFFIISIFVSFAFGMLVTLKLLGQKSVDFLLTNNQQIQIAERFRVIQGSVVRVFLDFKKFNYDVYKSVRNGVLFKQRNRTVIDTNSSNNISNDKQIESCSSITSESSDNQADPRYIYVLNLVENKNEKLNDCEKVSTSNDNYTYLNNCGNSSDRTICTTSNEELYLN